jgi:hypothetical protein
MSNLVHRLWFIVRHHPTRGCPFCGQLLEVCPQCRGQWQTTGCARCRIGALCPTHDRFWPS